MRIFQLLSKEKVADYNLSVEYMEKTRKGHWDVRIYLEDREGRRSAIPCVQGLYSVGRQDEAATGHFFQTELNSQIDFRDEGNRLYGRINLIDSFLGESLYGAIGRTIRPGGQLYLSYANEQRFGEDCEKAFRIGVPPIATMLGKLVALSGCIRVWTHYGAEGRFRIEGEKPATPEAKSDSIRDMLDVLNGYLRSLPKSVDDTSIEACYRDNAMRLVQYLQAMTGKTPPSLLSYEL